MKKTPVRGAVIQMSSGTDAKKNEKKAHALITKAARQKADFAVLPEVFLYRGSETNCPKGAEKTDGPYMRRLAALAKKLSIAVLAGTIYEPSSSQKVFNTSVWIGSDGEIKGFYRKRHLFDVDLPDTHLKESRTVRRGKSAKIIRDLGLKIGLSVCYDLRFPEHYSSYAKKSADIICVPSAFTKKTGKDHWKVLLRARAIENQCYIFAANQWGDGPHGVASYGHSMIVSPWGRVICESKERGDEVLIAPVLTEKTAEIRRLLPSLTERQKTDL